MDDVDEPQVDDEDEGDEGDDGGGGGGGKRKLSSSFLKTLTIGEPLEEAMRLPPGTILDN